MNRFQLVQVIIIAVALCLGYNCVNSFCWFANQAISSFGGDASIFSRYAILNGINALIFAFAFFWTLNKTTAIANWILTKTDLDPDVQLNISISSFLLGVIVFFGLKTIFESGAEIIAYLVKSFYSTTSHSTNWDGYQQPSVISSVIKFFASIILLRYAKDISQYFGKQTDENDPHQILGNVEPEESEL